MSPQDIDAASPNLPTHDGNALAFSKESSCLPLRLTKVPSLLQKSKKPSKVEKKTGTGSKNKPLKKAKRQLEKDLFPRKQKEEKYPPIHNEFINPNPKTG
jgi:hypothetical protein